ncbi:MAG: HNH endonuclease [Candidatus Binatia bacterium]
MTSSETFDREVRLRAFDFLSEQTSIHGDVLPWGILSKGFLQDGKRVPLIGPQGIFKPAILPQMPLSIATAPVREGEQHPYDDGLDEQGLLNYRYRGADPQHRDNAGLRLTMQRRVPLIYLFGVVKGEYMPVWPVFIVGDDPSALTFKVTIDDRQLGLLSAEAPTEQVAEARRSYVTVLTLRRLHQRTFSERVLNAYHDTCAICRLRHRELLDAAHILPDGHPRGEPIVPNGLALCKLHHAAFDAHILGVRPNYVIEVRDDILEEIDGPMLRHGLQEIAGQLIHLPRDQRLRPRSDLLEERYEMFRKVG